jgi:hypothetical protein
VLDIAYADAIAMPAVLSCPACPEDGFPTKFVLLRHMQRAHNLLPSEDELTIINKASREMINGKRNVKAAWNKGLSDVERKHCAPSSNGSVNEFRCVSCCVDVLKVNIVNHMHKRHGVDKELIKYWAMFKDANVLRYGKTYKTPKNASHCIFELLYHNASDNADESSDTDREYDQKHLGEEDSGHNRRQNAERTTTDEKKDWYWQNSGWKDPDVNHYDEKKSDWEASGWNASGGKWQGENLHTQGESWKDSEWCKSSGDWRSSHPASWDSDPWASGSKSSSKDDRGQCPARSIMMRLRSK